MILGAPQNQQVAPKNLSIIKPGYEHHSWNTNVTSNLEQEAQ